MRTELRALRALDRSERQVLVEAWLLLPRIDLVLRWRSLRAVRAWLSRRAKARFTGADGLSETRLAELVDIAARHHLHPGLHCLRRALCLHYLLARRGETASLKIGVRRQEGEFQAHAWVEVRGTPLGESPAAVGRYAPIGAWKA